REFNALQGEINNASRPNPAATAPPAQQSPDAAPIQGDNGEELLMANKTTGKIMHDLHLIAADGTVETKHLEGFQMIVPTTPYPPIAAASDTPGSRNAFGCTVATTAPAPCGEEAFHEDGDGVTLIPNGYDFDTLGTNQAFVAGPPSNTPQVLESTLDDINLANTAGICGFTVGIATNNTGLLGVRLRMYPGLPSGTSPTPVPVGCDQTGGCVPSCC